MFRRDLLKSAFLSFAAVATGRAVGPVAARAAESVTLLDTLSNELDHQLFVDDGLARPIPSPTSPRASTGRWPSVAEANIMSPGTAVSSTVFTTMGSTWPHCPKWWWGHPLDRIWGRR
jgi:hypothetical protein